MSDCWTGATSADWFTSTNWTTGTPTGATNIVIDQGSPNANPSIGINGTSNAAASAAVEIAATTGTSGLVTLSTTNSHPASWTIGGTLLLGEGGTGTINVSNGATLINTAGQTQIGSNAGSTGTLAIDGVGSLWNEQANSHRDQRRRCRHRLPDHCQWWRGHHHRQGQGNVVIGFKHRQTRHDHGRQRCHAKFGDPVHSIQ